jgi:hypothetical protein
MKTDDTNTKSATGADSLDRIVRNFDDEQDEGMRWCYGESSPYSLESLGNEAWLTGCPLCGDNCWEKATPEDKQEADDYFANVVITDSYRQSDPQPTQEEQR